ncbi:Cro/C1-type helix-turn-helix DNA-binding protein [Shimia isoporae]|uniref:Cro/C1-type helix-turn-helix DNA-binding protein n=1 Tax=Shimia isoporae TaxID=647720 RepID=A0A4R1N990_9RHOB|nr:helix-turn-helix transcriptional regulator [Shimia isoporae]TCK99442.1 Cro/C1-type helix-turn-helix DNA-binding protein [Shimia isoporae]
MRAETDEELGARIAAHIAALIEEQGTNPGAVARAAGLGVTSVRDIINGRARAPNVVTLVRIADVLKADPGDIISPQQSDPAANALYWSLDEGNKRRIRAIMRALVTDQEAQA